MIGLLWYEPYNDDPTTAVIHAAGRFLEKHGRWPTLAQVHHTTLIAADISLALDGDTRLQVTASSRILAHHVLVGDPA